MKKLLPVLLLLPFMGGCYWVPINIYHSVQGPIQNDGWIQNATDEELCTWYFEPRRRSEAMKKEILDRGIASEEELRKATWTLHTDRETELKLGMTKCEVMAGTGYKPALIDRWDAHGKRIEKWNYTDIAYILFEDGTVTKIENFYH